MPGPVKTQAVVLRSIRYGEADRILHLYTPDRGRVGAIAKGVRAHAQPLRRAPGAVLPPRPRPARGARRPAHGHGRGDRRRARPPARRRAPRWTPPPARATRSAACSTPPSRNPPVFHLLCQRARAARRGEPRRAGHARRTSSPSASSCCSPRASRRSSRRAPACGEREHLVGFSGAAGGVVCSACEAGGFPLDAEAHAFLADALGAPAGARRPTRPSARCARPSARSPRRSSTTPTCGCAPRGAG